MASSGFDIQARLRDVQTRAQSLRPNLLPQLQQQLAARGRGQLLGRIIGSPAPPSGQSLAAKAATMFPDWTGAKDFRSKGPAGYRQDFDGPVNVDAASGFRLPT